jgi:hypothetical protein
VVVPHHPEEEEEQLLGAASGVMTGFRVASHQKLLEMVAQIIVVCGLMIFLPAVG